MCSTLHLKFLTSHPKPYWIDGLRVKFGVSGFEVKGLRLGFRV